MARDANNPDVQSSAELLEVACERGAPIELHHRTPKDEVFVGHTKILSMDERFLYLNRPQSIGETPHYAVGQDLEAYFSLHDSLYSFETQVAATNLIITLDDRRQVAGISVVRPKGLCTGQRRSHYRASLASLHVIPAELHFANPTEPGACPVNARRCSGSLVDLSVGGASVVVPNILYSTTRTDEDNLSERFAGFTEGEQMFVSFTLPGESRRVWYLTEIRQARPVLDGLVTRLGLRFLSWPDDHHMRIQQQMLQRFVAQLQRAALKRSI